KTGKKVHYSSLPQFMTLPLSFPPSVPPSFSLSLSHTHTHTHILTHTHTHTIKPCVSCVWPSSTPVILQLTTGPGISVWLLITWEEREGEKLGPIEVGS